MITTKVTLSLTWNQSKVHAMFEVPQHKLTMSTYKHKT